MCQRRFPACVRPLFLCGVVLAGSGCVPNVVWLPDSGGFVYTVTDWPGTAPDKRNVQDGRLVHYDLAKKASRVIAMDGATIRPALSLDGQRVAIARVDLEQNKPATLRLTVYDLQGKAVHTSKPLPWGEPPRGQVADERYAELSWAPNANRVLVYANKHAGIYNPETGQARMLGAGRPSIFGTTPVRPDGTGFLLSRAEANVAFVDWEGQETAIPLPRERAAVREQGIVAAPAALCWSRWEEAVAVATWKGGELRLDTARKTAAYRRPEKDAWAWNDQELQESYTFPKGQTRLVVVYLKSYRDFRDAGLPSVRVELLGPGPDQRRTLVTEAPHCGVFPSPNGEFVALRYAVLGKGADNAVRDRILVVNRQAEVVAEFDAGK